MPPRGATRLTDRAVAMAAPPVIGLVELWDSVRPGLHLRLFATGGRIWAYRYRFAGRQGRQKIGRYPVVSLADARAEAKRIAEAIHRGEDPRARGDAVQPTRQLAALRRLAGELGAEVTLVQPEPVDSFGDLVSRYLAEHAVRKRSGAEDARLLARDALPAWRDRPATEIRRRDVKALLDSVVARGAPVAANRLRAVLSSVFGFGLEAEIVEANPARDVKRPTRERPRSRVLSDRELRALWLALEIEHPVLRALFQLLMLTGQRSGEVRQLRWSDLEGDLWTIPEAFTKGARAHAVPLAPPAVSIIEALRPQTGRRIWVLESPRCPGEPLGRGLAHAAQRIGGRAGVIGWGPHDLRRTVATQLGAMGYGEVVPAVLGHAATGVTRRHYNLYAYLNEKRAALVAWAERLSSIVESSIAA